MHEIDPTTIRHVPLPIPDQVIERPAGTKPEPLQVGEPARADRPTPVDIPAPSRAKPPETVERAAPARTQQPAPVELPAPRRAEQPQTLDAPPRQTRMPESPSVTVVESKPFIDVDRLVALGYFSDYPERKR